MTRPSNATLKHTLKLGDKRNTGPFDHIELPSFEVTSQGMKCRLPVAEVDGITIAVLLVQTALNHVGLLLHPAPNNELQDPNRGTYYVSWVFTGIPRGIYARLANLGDNLYNLRFRGMSLYPKWRDILIRAQPRAKDRSDGAHLVLRFTPDISPAPFRIPRCIMHALAALKLLPYTSLLPEDAAAKNARLVVFFDTVSGEKIRIALGLCARRSTAVSSCHWAFAEHTHRASFHDPMTKRAHDCATDHIEDWGPECTRDFGDAERTVRLSFAPCPHAPRLGQTLVLGMDLVGRAYEALQRDAGVVVVARAPFVARPPPPRPSPLPSPPPTPPKAPRSRSDRPRRVLGLVR